MGGEKCRNIVVAEESWGHLFRRSRFEKKDNCVTGETLEELGGGKNFQSRRGKKLCKVVTKRKRKKDQTYRSKRKGKVIWSSGGRICKTEGGRASGDRLGGSSVLAVPGKKETCSY